MNKQQIAYYIQSELSLLFPNNYTDAAVRNILGEVIQVTYTKGRNKSEYVNGIIQNDPAFFRVLLHGPRDGGPGKWYIEGTRLGPIKFRKISAGTELGLAVKLVEWFERNAELIKSI